MYTNLIEQFLQYFNITSYLFDRCDLPYNVTSQDVSVASTQLSKEIDFYNNVIYQTTFQSPQSDGIQTVFKQVTAAMKSLLQSFEINNIYSLTSDKVDNLLTSFGFSNISLPLYIKQDILQVLVYCYKNKGTLNVQTIFDAIYPHFEFTELFFNKNLFTFQGTITINGDQQIINLPVQPVISNDIYWQLTTEQLQAWPESYVLSPYLTGYNIVSVTDNNAASAMLRTLSVQQLTQFNSNPSIYRNTYQTIQLDPIPFTISWLEIYLLLRYIFLLNQNVSFLIPNLNSYLFYNRKDSNNNPDYSLFNSDYSANFLQEQTLPQQQIGTVNITDVSIKSITSLKPVIDSTITANIQLSNIAQLNDISYGAFKDVTIIYGSDINGYQLLLFDTYNSGNYVQYTVDIQLLNPTIFYNDRVIMLYGGYNLDGTKNYNVYYIDMTTNESYSRAIAQNLWYGNSSVVQSDSEFFVLVKDGNCSGCIFSTSTSAIDYRLLYKLDPSVINIQNTITFNFNGKLGLMAPDINNHLHLIVIDHQYNHFVYDMLCLLKANNNASNIYYSLMNNTITYVIPDGENELFLFTSDNIIYKVIVSLEQGESQTYIIPMYMSSTLTPYYEASLYSPTYEDPNVVNSITISGFINLSNSENYYQNWPYYKLCYWCSPENYSNFLSIGITESILQFQNPNTNILDTYTIPTTLPNVCTTLYEFGTQTESSNNQGVDYDTNLIYDQSSVSGGLLTDYVYDNISSCGLDYDSLLTYDSSTQYYWVPALPLYQDLTINSMYKSLDLPSYLMVLLSITNLQEDIISVNNLQVINSSSGTPVHSIIYTNGTNIYLSYIISKIGEVVYQSTTNTTFCCTTEESCTQTSSNSPLCFVMNALQNRQTLFENSYLLPYSSPILSNQDILNLISQLNSNLYDYVLSSQFNASIVNYSLSLYLDNLYSGANFVQLDPTIINSLSTMFLPIHSRFASLGHLIQINDPIGDYVSLTDLVGNFPFINLYENISLLDYIHRNDLTYSILDPITFSDSCTIGPMN